MYTVLRNGLNLLAFLLILLKETKHSWHRETEVEYFHHFNCFLFIFIFLKHCFNSRCGITNRIFSRATLWDSNRIISLFRARNKFHTVRKFIVVYCHDHFQLTLFHSSSLCFPILNLIHFEQFFDSAQLLINKAIFLLFLLPEIRQWGLDGTRLRADVRREGWVLPPAYYKLPNKSPQLKRKVLVLTRFHDCQTCY